MTANERQMVRLLGEARDELRRLHAIDFCPDCEDGEACGPRAKIHEITTYLRALGDECVTPESVDATADAMIERAGL